MAREEKYYCDFCKGEVWHQSRCAVVKIQATQWPQGYDGNKEFDSILWRHRDDFQYLVCEDCCGEKITINHGHDARFSFSEGFKVFLKKIGIVKSQ